jgi:hypothetical protein
MWLNDPKRDAEHNVARLLRRQLKSYKKDDPKEEQQKALPVCVLHLILSSKSTEICQAMGELAGAAHFWAMRSCEYAKVPKAEQRQTKQLCIRNIAFIKDGESVDHKSLSLHLADSVLVTFERQKNDRKADTVTQWRTSDELLCPVKIWASLIRQISSYKGASKDSPVSLVQYKGKIINITGEMIADFRRIRDRDKIHSLRSSNGNVPRWSSSFVDHANRKMVEHSLPQIHLKASTGVSQGISSKMIEVQSFKHVQNPTETNPMENIVGDSFSLLMG